MDNKKIIDNYNYGLIIYNKYTFYDNLELTISKYNEEFSLPLVMLLSLYIIDFNNIDKELYTENELTSIEKLTDALEKNIDSIININTQEIKKILESCQDKRIPASLNKKICLKLADFNNKKYKDNIEQYINMEKLIKTLDQIK